MSSYSYHIAILNENICFTGFLNFFFAHKKIKIFRVGGKNRVGRVTPIKQFFFRPKHKYTQETDSLNTIIVGRKTNTT